MEADVATVVSAIAGQVTLDSEFCRKRFEADDLDRDGVRFLNRRTAGLPGTWALNRRGRFFCRPFQTRHR